MRAAFPHHGVDAHLCKRTCLPEGDLCAFAYSADSAQIIEAAVLWHGFLSRGRGRPEDQPHVPHGKTPRCWLTPRCCANGMRKRIRVRGIRVRGHSTRPAFCAQDGGVSHQASPACIRVALCGMSTQVIPVSLEAVPWRGRTPRRDRIDQPRRASPSNDHGPSSGADAGTRDIGR